MPVFPISPSDSIHHPYNFIHLGDYHIHSGSPEMCTYRPTTIRSYPMLWAFSAPFVCMLNSKDTSLFQNSKLQTHSSLCCDALSLHLPWVLLIAVWQIPTHSSKPTYAQLLWESSTYYVWKISPSYHSTYLHTYFYFLHLTFIDGQVCARVLGLKYEDE